MQVQATEKLFDRTYWNHRLSALREKFSHAQPFPHIVLDDFLNPEMANKILKKFPDPRASSWIQYHHFNEKLRSNATRSAFNPLIQKVFGELLSSQMIEFLQNISDIPHLMGDPTIEGGGLLCAKKGDFLNIHEDFAVHPHQPFWKRRVNLLLYLNEDWQEEYGGHLEFWDREMKQCITKIRPIFNRCVIFRSDIHAHHGYPEPLKCPSSRARYGIASYYYTLESSQPKSHSTHYQSRPNDGALKSVGIQLDNKLIAIYEWLKKRFGISDHVGSTVMKWFS